MNKSENPEIICLVCIEKHGHDSYNEDYSGRETHSIEYKTTVQTYEVSLETIDEWVEQYMSSNADNPPYDTYDIKFGYWKKDNVLIPRHILL